MLKKISWIFGILLFVIGFLYLISCLIALFDNWSKYSENARANKQPIEKPAKLLDKPIPFVLNENLTKEGWNLKKNGNMYFLKKAVGNKQETFNLRVVEPKDPETTEKCITNLGGKTGQRCLCLWLIECKDYSLEDSLVKKGYHLVNKRYVRDDLVNAEFGLLIPGKQKNTKEYVELKEVIVAQSAKKPADAVTKPRIIYDSKQKGFLVKTDKSIEIPDPYITPPHYSTYAHKHGFGR